MGQVHHWLTFVFVALNLLNFVLLYSVKSLFIWNFQQLVAFDEDFEAELAENYDAKTEVSLLAKNPDPELTEVTYQTC